MSRTDNAGLIDFVVTDFMQLDRKEVVNFIRDHESELRINVHNALDDFATAYIMKSRESVFIYDLESVANAIVDELKKRLGLEESTPA